MAETAIGVVGLLSLLSIVIDCFEYVRVAKTYKRDFETAQTKFDCAGWCLVRWAEAVGIRDASNDQVLFERYERAEIILKHLELLCTQTREKSNIFHQSDVELHDVDLMNPVQAVVHIGVRNRIRARLGRQQKEAVHAQEVSVKEKTQ